MTTICLTQCNTSPLHRVDQVVDCGLWNVGPLLFQWLCEVSGYWQELEYAVVYTDPEHPKYAQWGNMPGEYVGHARTGMFQLPGIVYRSLQHRTVHYHAATRVRASFVGFFDTRCQIDTVKTVPVPKRCLNRYLQKLPINIGLAISTKHMGRFHRQGLD